MGAALGREARSGGAQVLLDVPDVNLSAARLSGRSADTYSEDPCLTGELGRGVPPRRAERGGRWLHGAAGRNNQETDRRTPTAVWTSARCTKSTCPRLRRP